MKKILHSELTSVPVSIVVASLVTFGLLSICCAAETRVEVANSSSFGRTQEAVVIPWTSLKADLQKLDAQHILVLDEQGVPLIYQVDDLNGDSIPDELVFQADFLARQTRTFTISEGTGANADSLPTPRTDAQDWKRINGVPQSVDVDEVEGAARDRKNYRYDGVGWESDVVAYRLYLDERNAVDIQGKRKRGLYWHFIGSTKVDYQLDADWGMDVLHVGPALGIGGIGIWTGDSVMKPWKLDRQKCRIIARGPVRAVVQVDYVGWNTGTGAVDLSSRFMIYAGERTTVHRVTLGGGASSVVLATGIVIHDSTETIWNKEKGWLYTVGHQSRANDSLMMALQVDPARVIRQTDDQYNHLILLNLDAMHPVEILISSYWQGERRSPWSGNVLDRFVQTTARRMSEPLSISCKQ